jgi:hypothetical protein
LQATKTGKNEPTMTELVIPTEVASQPTIALADAQAAKDTLCQLMSSARDCALRLAADGRQGCAEYYKGRTEAFELAARIVFELPGFVIR